MNTEKFLLNGKQHIIDFFSAWLISFHLFAMPMRYGPAIMLWCAYLLQYLDAVMRLLMDDGSFFVWAFINSMKRRGYEDILVIEQLRYVWHLPERIIVLFLISFIQVIMLRIIICAFKKNRCTTGSATWHALRSIPSIIWYAMVQAIILEYCGDLILFCVTPVLSYLADSNMTHLLMNDMWYGMRMLSLPSTVMYTLPYSVRLFGTLCWRMLSFSWLSIIATARYSCMQSMYRAIALVRATYGYCIGFVSYAMVVQTVLMSVTWYYYALTFPPLDGLGMRGLQIVVLYASVCIMLFSMIQVYVAWILNIDGIILSEKEELLELQYIKTIPMQGMFFYYILRFIAFLLAIVCMHGIIVLLSPII